MEHKLYRKWTTDKGTIKIQYRGRDSLSIFTSTVDVDFLLPMKEVGQLKEFLTLCEIAHFKARYCS